MATNHILRLKRWLPLLLIIALMVIAFATGLHEKFNLQVLQDHKEDLLAYVSERSFLSSLIFIFAYIVSVALSLPIATVFDIGGGISVR